MDSGAWWATPWGHKESDTTEHTQHSSGEVLVCSGQWSEQFQLQSTCVLLKTTQLNCFVVCWILGVLSMFSELVYFYVHIWFSQ